MALMRALPMDEDADLVLRVVRKTLKSTGVSVDELVESARKRESTLADDIANDREAIVQFEREIAERKTRIEDVTKQLAETESVRRKLEEAIENESRVGVLIPPDEMAILKAEAEAAPASGSIGAPVPLPPPPPLTPSTPIKPSKPPPLKASVPPPLKRPLPPKPPPLIPGKLVRAPEAISAGAPSAGAPPSGAVPVVPEPKAPASSSPEGPPSEPTLKLAADASGESKESKKDRDDRASS
jgi:hypothetical protein